MNSLFPKQVELHTLLRYYDVDGTEGQVLFYGNFISDLRGKLSARKRDAVVRAFNRVEVSGRA